jgi:glycerate 2-kinase
MDVARARKEALAIFEAGVEAVDPVRAVKEHVVAEDDRLMIGDRTYELSAFDNIYAFGAGKAAAAMALAVEEILDGKLNSGLVSTKYGHGLPLHIVQVNEAGHPVPDEAGFKGARQIVQFLEKTGEKDLVIFLISGGGSALLPYPAEGVTLEDIQKVTRVLLDVGATIQEINALRKHLSRVKGGRLARLAYPSALVSLILSDVIGDDLDSIASGPTVPDHSTFSDCLKIVDKYGIKERIPAAVVKIFVKGSRGEIEETPKPGDPVFERTQNLIIGSNIHALRAAEKKAAELGYHTFILSSFVQGETREVAKVHAAIVKEILGSANPVERPACVLSGGETTVTIRGKGKGGRNMEFALAASIEIDGMMDVVVLSAGTDGTDGPTDAAGAVADGATASRAEERGMDPSHYLHENDSYHFFEALDDLIVTGPTRTNVMDLRVVLVI